MNDLRPEEQVAKQFMERKGYRIKPASIEKLEGQPCWYFIYNLPEGTLELEVFWNKAAREWETLVTTFGLAE